MRSDSSGSSWTFRRGCRAPFHPPAPNVGSPPFPFRSEGIGSAPDRRHPGPWVEVSSDEGPKVGGGSLEIVRKSPWRKGLPGC
jgi:hypothetical protein